MPIDGWATLDGTARYRERFREVAAPAHFRQQQELWFSSIGMGTYLGDADDETDARYAEAVTRAVELGANVIDTAANYRFQRSERAIGNALRDTFGVRENDVVLTEPFLRFYAGAAPLVAEKKRLTHFTKIAAVSGGNVTESIPPETVAVVFEIASVTVPVRPMLLTGIACVTLLLGSRLNAATAISLPLTRPYA